MALTPDEYARNGIQDASDVMERGEDKAWPDDQVWDLDGKQVTEAQFQEAWAHFEKTGERPDFWD